MNVQLVVASGSRAGQVIPIVGERFVIGRADDCNLKPRSELISRYHCEISLKEGDVFVRDLGSKNGVFLNDTQITEATVANNGDKLVIGPLDFFIKIVLDMKSPKAAKVKSVSDAVARTVAIQSEHKERSQEDTITDWLLASGENADELETRAADAFEMKTQLMPPSGDTKEMDEHREANPPSGSGVKPGTHASSRDAASELLKKFFKGGK